MSCLSPFELMLFIHEYLKQGNAFSIPCVLQVLTISRMLKHDNIVQILGYFIEGENRVLAYEYAPKGSLHGILHGKE